MEKRYKLKKDARAFFPRMGEEIQYLEYWTKNGIHLNLIEEVDDVYIEYGIKNSTNGSSLKSWDSNDGKIPNGKFHFTVHVNNIDCKSHDSVSIPDMMDEMQKVLNRFFDNA